MENNTETERTPVEKLKSYFSIKGYLNEEQQKSLFGYLNLQEEDFERFIGLDLEFEFMLMCYFLGNCKEIVGFDEGIARLTDVPCPDLYIKLKNNKKIMIEIKRQNINISKSGLEKQIQFAKSFGAIFYIAIKQNGLWALYHSDYIRKKNRKIKFEDDYLNSKLDSVLGNMTFLIPAGLKFISTYNANIYTETEPQIYDNYGKLINFKIEYNGKTIHEYDYTHLHNRDIERSFICEPLIDIACLNRQEKIIKENIIEITDEIMQNTYLPLYSFLLLQVKHTKDTNGLFDYCKFLKMLYEKKYDYKGIKKLALNNLHFIKQNGCNIVITRFIGDIDFINLFKFKFQQIIQKFTQKY